MNTLDGIMKDLVKGDRKFASDNDSTSSQVPSNTQWNDFFCNTLSFIFLISIFFSTHNHLDSLPF